MGTCVGGAKDVWGRVVGVWGESGWGEGDLWGGGREVVKGSSYLTLVLLQRRVSSW